MNSVYDARWIALLCIATLCAQPSDAWGEQIAPDLKEVAPALKVGRAWPGLPVGFALLTEGDFQLAAWYDPDQRLVVASRQLGEQSWTRNTLPEQVPWDSHNSIVLEIDETGHIHLSGNMHVDPLNYYRTTRPMDVTSFKQVDHMVGRDEDRCTYPTFMKGPDGQLIFMYRDGSSGNGRRIMNRYDSKTQQWSRLIHTPLLDGGGRVNAYPKGPILGPDGLYHIVWMWRGTPDAATNHNISYMRSKDLVHWQSANGKPITLPVGTDTAGVVIDPVPARAGLINMVYGIGFDQAHRPIIMYHKYDSNGHSQIFNARWEADAWHIYQASDWDERWDFGGGGSIASKVRAQPIQVLPDGQLVQTWRHWKHGSGAWVLDPDKLTPTGSIDLGGKMPTHLGKANSTFPGMGVRWAFDTADSRPDGHVYRLRWETLGRNRDHPRTGPLPEPSTLELYEFAPSAPSEEPDATKRLTPQR